MSTLFKTSKIFSKYQLSVTTIRDESSLAITINVLRHFISISVMSNTRIYLVWDFDDIY